jgi:6-pyruvoyltetrahydropterin/6-carboxytetrahydropterin synthase
MFELIQERYLHVRHALRLYDGEYEPMHSHRWLVSACVTAGELDRIGAVMDFNELDRLLADVLAALESKPLNEQPAFAERNSSSEIMAKYIFDQLAAQLPEHVRLARVELQRDEAVRARFVYLGP